MGPGPHESTFENLAARIQAGDAAAEEEFVGVFQRRIRGYAMVHTGDRDLAEDLIQEVLWVVIRSLREGKVQQPAQLPAFVLGTARNLMHNKLRSLAREKLEPLTEEVDPGRPAMEQEGFERDRAARQAIETLEPPERAVLLLSLVDGLGPEEIAKRLGITGETVRQRKSRALKKLAGLLGPRSQLVRR